MIDSVTWFLGKVMEYLSEPYQSWDTFVHAITYGIRFFTETEGKLHWIYLGSSLLLGIGVYAVEKRRGRIAPGTSLARFLFPREVYRHPSSIVDYKYVAIDLTVKSLTYAPLISGMTILSYKATLYVSESTWLTWLPSIPAHPILVAFIAVLVADFGVFFGHYLGHKVPLFWIFHQVHHSAQVLNPLTTYRGHPVDELLGTLAVSMATAMFAVTYTVTSGEPVNMATILGLNAFTFFFTSRGISCGIPISGCPMVRCSVGSLLARLSTKSITVWTQSIWTRTLASYSPYGMFCSDRSIFHEPRSHFVLA